MFKRNAFFVDPLPQSIIKKYNLPELKSALKSIHFPKSLNEAKIAKKRFLFEDVFILELIILTQRQKMKQAKGFLIKTKMDVLEKFSQELNFQLTDDQKKALVDILKDLQKGKPMNRLLQGDVGSGKTIVAAMAALMTVTNNYQVAFMVPTEILAKQHFQNFSQLFKNFDINIGLLTSNDAQINFLGLISKVKKSDFLKDCFNQKIDIIIGTHALIQKNVKFKNLGLIIIDEQHRFWYKAAKSFISNQKRLYSSFIINDSYSYSSFFSLVFMGGFGYFFY
jgi:ATP-dependent DNA helicase RecG